MIQFTPEQIAKLRVKSGKEAVLERLKQHTALVYGREPLIQTEGIANWKHYYYCPSCSVQLKFDIDSPKAHVCPVCGRSCTGEPFDSTWWGFVIALNYQAAYEMALIYLLTEDKAYLEKVKDLLLGYAKYYPGYAVHGDIPYNHPGKAEAQALNEALFIRNMACAYDIVSDKLTEAERAFVRDNLLTPGAEFLRGSRTDQLHNHEIIINAAIGVCALILERDDLLNFAVYEKYGLRYQLEHAVLADKLWFECSVGYHFFAFQNFLGFERFAVNTEHCRLDHPNYTAMVDIAARLLMPDWSFPPINDCHPEGLFLGPASSRYGVFEVMWNKCGSRSALAMLNKIYDGIPRDNADAFFYGADELPQAGLSLEDYHNADGSGFTVKHSPDSRFFLMKHGPFAGEHDHYDRLNIIYHSHGERVLPDFGTTGYGAFYHYEYFKNTGTHNTVVIGEENHAPAAGRVNSYSNGGGVMSLDAEVNWIDGYVPPDSFTIVQWSEEAYRGVKFRRQVRVSDEGYFVDVFEVDNVDGRTIDWVMHFRGRRTARHANERPVEAFSEKKPFKYLKNVSSLTHNGLIKTVFAAGKAEAALYSHMAGAELIFASGPDNPTHTDADYVIQRVRGKSAIFVNIAETYAAGGPPVILGAEVSRTDGKVAVSVATALGEKTFEFEVQV